MRLRWLVLLLAIPAFAQQPPFRVRLLTLYHLHDITVTPSGESSARIGGRNIALSGPLAIAVDGGLVRASGKTAQSISLQGAFLIRGESTRDIRLHVPLEITAQDGELRIIALFPTEEYVAAVVQGETAGDMPSEALKALSVSVRSYATRFRERHKEDGFDFCDTTHCQYVRTEVGARVRDAVQQTANLMLWDRGAPLAAYYHKDCGGRTEDAAAIWPDQKSSSLVSHEDPYCIRTSKPWKSEIARTDIDRALAASGLQVPNGWDRITVAYRTASARARMLRISVGTTQRAKLVSASSFRFALGRALGWNTLKSDWYDVTATGDRFLFSGRGTGHGVGLCQTGAAQMAREGKTYREILALYYPGAEIGRSAKGIAWKTFRESGFDIRAVNDADAAATREPARAAFAFAEKETGLRFESRPTVDVFPTVAMFRDATGEPGWVAASTRGEHVRIEPPTIVKEQFAVLMRHEFLHLLIEANAKQGTPLWFREGLVLVISGEESEDVSMPVDAIEAAIRGRDDELRVRRAYAAAATRVRELEKEHGRGELLRRLREGTQ